MFSPWPPVFVILSVFLQKQNPLEPRDDEFRPIPQQCKLSNYATITPVLTVMAQSFREMLNYSDLSWEAEASGDARHGSRNKVVEVAIGRSGQLESTEADVIQSLVVNAVRFIRVFNQLMHWQRCIVRLHDCVRHLYRITASQNFHLIKNQLIICHANDTAHTG